MTGSGEGITHVIADCNIYLRLFHHFGRVPGLDELSEFSNPSERGVGNTSSAAFHSAAFLSYCYRVQHVEIWTSEHILDTVRYKLLQPEGEDGGFGWTEDDLAGFEGFFDGVHLLEVAVPGNAPVGAEFNPPLDHEDGMVYGACKNIAGEYPLSRVVCATWDRQFRDYFSNGNLESYIEVLGPNDFMKSEYDRIRQAQAKARNAHFSRIRGGGENKDS